MTPEEKLKKAALEEEADKLLVDSHQQWLLHPVTQQVLKNIRAHREHIIAEIARHATNNDLPQLQINGIHLSKLDAIVQLITTTQLHIQNAKK